MARPGCNHCEPMAGTKYAFVDAHMLCHDINIYVHAQTLLKSMNNEVASLKTEQFHLHSHASMGMTSWQVYYKGRSLPPYFPIWACMAHCLVGEGPQTAFALLKAL